VLKDSHILEEKLAAAASDAARIELLNELAHRVIGPYIIMAIVLLALGIMIRIAHLPEVHPEEEDVAATDGRSARSSVFQYPHLVLGVVALFFYVGVEVIAGDTIIRYGQSLNVAMDSAKYFTSLTLLGMVIGYILGIIFIPKYITQGNALKICATLGIIFSLGAILSPAHLSVQMPFRDLVTFEPVLLTIPVTALFVALLGVANSLVWPAMWPLAIDGLGKFTKIASALLIMAIAGGAVLPLVYGKLADLFNTQTAYWTLVPSYVVILAYSIWWHKYRSWN
jgi:fucose permease